MHEGNLEEELPRKENIGSVDSDLGHEAEDTLYPLDRFNKATKTHGGVCPLPMKLY